MTVPIRTCVGCRRRRPQGELLRFRRRADGHVVASDRRGRGRSAYLCPSRPCFDRALTRRHLSRALGRGRVVVCDPAEILDSVRDRLVAGEVA